jgi:hypothetical protein
VSIAEFAKSGRVACTCVRRREAVMHFGQRAFQAPPLKILKSSCGDGRNNTSDVWTWPVTRLCVGPQGCGRQVEKRGLARGDGQFGFHLPPERDARAIGLRSSPRVDSAVNWQRLVGVRLLDHEMPSLKHGTHRPEHGPKWD